MKKRVFVSVYDKVGLIDFARNLVEKFDYELVAAGDTLEVLQKADIEVIDIKQFSGCPTLLTGDMVDGSGTDMLNEMEKFAIKSFDMVVINLCPFEKIVIENDSVDEMLQKIDIAGYALLRAAAKNYKNVTVIADKTDYLVALNANEFGRLKLAAKAFNLTASYDRLVSSKLSEVTGDKQFKFLNLEKIADLEHGENIHQKASIYKTDKMVNYEVLWGEELSFNNILNLDEVMNILSEFYDVNASAIVRHTKPCGVALGQTVYDAYIKAFDCDPISSFYATIGFTQTVDSEVAKYINSTAVEVIIAPDFDEKALELFKDNNGIKLIKLNTPLAAYKKLKCEEILNTPFGILIQDRNNSELNKDLFKVVTTAKPTAEQIEDAIFAWKVVKHAKTNSAVIAKDFKTAAIVQGQTNTLSASELALNYACENSKEAVLATDDIIQSEDCIYAAAQGRISLIIQPGGSIKDQKIIDACNKYNIAMITTGITNSVH